MVVRLLIFRKRMGQEKNYEQTIAQSAQTEALPETDKTESLME